jgi:hypothetical protein
VSKTASADKVAETIARQNANENLRRTTAAADVHGRLCRLNQIEADLRRVTEEIRCAPGGTAQQRATSEFTRLRQDHEAALESWRSAVLALEAFNESVARRESDRLAPAVQRLYNAYVAAPSFDSREAFMRERAEMDRWVDVAAQARAHINLANERVQAGLSRRHW